MTHASCIMLVLDGVAQNEGPTPPASWKMTPRLTWYTLPVPARRLLHTSQLTVPGARGHGQRPMQWQSLKSDCRSYRSYLRETSPLIKTSPQQPYKPRSSSLHIKILKLRLSNILFKMTAKVKDNSKAKWLMSYTTFYKTDPNSMSR